VKEFICSQKHLNIQQYTVGIKEKMTSDDLKKFFKLYFEKGFQIKNFSVSMSIDDESKTKIELVNDELKEIIESNEEDIAHTIPLNESFHHCYIQLYS
jgi:hypothetical protein